MSRWTVRRTALGAMVLSISVLLAACDSVEERAEKHFQRGQELVEQGEPEKALLEFRNALSMNEKHVPTLFAMGGVHESRGDIQAAFAAYRSVVDIDTRHLAAQIKVARFQLLSGDIEQVATTVETAMRLDPANAEVHALDAAVSMRNGDLEAARDKIEQSLALNPDLQDARVLEVGYLLQTGKPAAALTKADEVLEAFPDSLPLHMLKLQILERNTDTAGVGAQLRVMTSIFPDELRFREGLARWAVRNGEPETARTELRALVEALPGNQDAIVNLIRFIRNTDGEPAARVELSRLIDAADEPFELELMRVQFDLETGAEEQAVADLRDLIGRAGENAPRARVRLAGLLTRRNEAGDRDEAGTLISEALAEDPGNADALSMRASRLLDADRVEEAFGNIRLGLKEAPDDVQLLVLAGRAHEMSGSVDLANDRLARAVRTSNYNVETVERYVEFLLRNSRFTAAEIILNEAAQRNPGNAQILSLLGFTRVRLENWSGAGAVARALERLDPVQGRQLQAAILIEQERFDEGAQMLRSLQSDDRTGGESVAALVLAYTRAGNTDEAIVFLEKLIEEDPENLQAMGIRSNFHIVAGEFEAAESLLREILRLQPDHGGAYSALARVAAARGDDAAIEELLIAGLEASPDNLLLLARLAQLQEGRGEFIAAIATYERLYTLTPRSLLVTNNLASLLSDHRADDPEAIERAYKLASRLAGIDRPQYRDTFGWTRYLKGEHEEALSVIEPLLEALPGNPWIHYHLGMIYNALGRTEEARQQLNAALAAGDGTSSPVHAKVSGVLKEISAQ